MDDFFEVVADVTDDLVGVASVQVEYSINKGSIQTLEMNLEPISTGFGDPDFLALFEAYKATVEFGENLQESDLLDYRIVAVDKANASNRSTSPASGFYSVNISIRNSITFVTRPIICAYINTCMITINSGFRKR